MNWPLPQDINEAVQNPALAFEDADLRSGETVVGPTGLPLPRSGNFADVYQIRGASGRDWAVKCFTRPVTGLEHRYAKVDEALRKAALPFTIGFSFLPNGVRVHDAWRPAVKMEWVDGLQLNQVVRTQAGNPKALELLVQMWSRLCRKLREAGIAHADLQHGNVLLVAGSKPGAYSLKLIDYDGMFVPALANTPSGESGHPNYQHPQRAAKQVYSPDLDRFPHLVVATALKGLAVLGPKLWEKYDTGDNLLFTEDDFRSPVASSLMKELWQSNEPGLQSLVGHLAIACGKPIPQTPWLDQLAPEGVPSALTPEQARAAATALGVPPPPFAAVRPVSAEEYGVELLPQPVNEFAALSPAPAPDHRRKDDEDDEFEPRRPLRKKSPAVPIAIAVGALLFVGAAVVGGMFLLGDKNPDEVARNPNEKQPDGKEQTKQNGNDKEKEHPKLPSPKPPETELDPPKKDPIVPPSPIGPVTKQKFDPAGAARLTQLWEFTNPAPVHEVRLSWDGKWLAARETGPAVRVFDARTGDRLNGFAEERAAVLDFANLDDGNLVSWHLDQPFAIVWNPGTGKGVAKLPIGDPPAPPKANSRSVRFFDVSPNGHYSAAGFTTLNGKRSPGETGRILIHDTQENRTLGTLSLLQPILRFAGNRLLVADIERIAWYTLPGLKLDREFPLTADVVSRVVAVSRDGNLVLRSDQTHEPRVHETAGGKRVATFPRRFTASAGAISNDNRLIALASTESVHGAFVEVLDMEEEKVIGRFPLSGPLDVQQLLFAPDNSCIVAKRSTRHVQVIELPKSLVAALPKPKDPDPVPKPKDPGPTPKPKDPGPVPKPKDPDPAPKIELVAVPDAAAIAAAEKKIRGMLMVEYARKLGAERRALAGKLIGLAKDESDSADRYVLFRDARDIYIEVFEPELAMQALDGIIRHYRVDADAERLALFEKVKDTAGNVTARRSVAEMSLAASDLSLVKDDFTYAVKFAQTALSAAKLGNLPQTFQEDVESQITRMKKQAESFAAVKEALERIKRDPDDRDSAYVVGRYRCFTQGRWDEGLPALAKGATGALKAAAEKDAAAPRTLPADVKLADAWWNAAQGITDADKAAILFRARFWYARALPALKGDARTLAENRFGFTDGGVDYRGGLLAEFTGKAPAILQGKKARIDPIVDFDAGQFKADGTGTTTDLGAKWTGVLAPQRPGRYRLILVATDPASVRIDGKLLLDTNAKTTRKESILSLPDHPVPIVVEFKSVNAEKHNVKLLWSMPGTEAEELVPAENFYHDRKLETVLGKSP